MSILSLIYHFFDVPREKMLFHFYLLFALPCVVDAACRCCRDSEKPADENEWRRRYNSGRLVPLQLGLYYKNMPCASRKGRARAYLKKAIVSWRGVASGGA